MIQQDEDDIIFEPISSGSVFNGSSNPTKQPVEGFYSSLYDELLEKCEPTKFLEPYDEEKTNTANDIYSITLSNCNNINTLRELRSRAMHELGVRFSTRVLYNELIDICDPRHFSGNNYDKNLFEKSNRLYGKTNRFADNIEKLEEIKNEASDLYIIIQDRRKKEHIRIEKEKVVSQIIRQNNNTLIELKSIVNGLTILLWIISIILIVTIFKFVDCLSFYDFQVIITFIICILLLVFIAIFLFIKIRKSRHKLIIFKNSLKT